MLVKPMAREEAQVVTSPKRKREQRTNSQDSAGHCWVLPKAKLALAVSTVLETKRWEVKKGPFRGFNSPPGRF